MHTPEQLDAALNGRYQIERRIGEGGMASVFLARDLRHSRNVALKVLKPDLGAALGTERFLREIALTAGLRHPHILPLYDSGAVGGALFYVMPFVEGESLRERITEKGQLAVEDALRLIEEIADALQHAHLHGIIHRDIKPENILLEGDHAVVADFGIAQAVGTSGSEKLTSTGLSIGTPAYMSPEQCSGEQVDARSDLYALGCLLYEMLAGVPPFTGKNNMAVIARHMMDPVPPLATIRPGVPPHVVAAIEAALAKAPEDRPASVEIWRDSLRSARVSETVRLLKRPPAAATRMLGRSAQLESVIEQLRGGARVISLTGVGGTGKTRFAVELFSRVESDYDGGAAFVSLASVTDPSEVLPTVATVLSIAEAHGRTAIDAVVTLIGNRRFLLVLDNLEQVIDSAGDIAELVSRCSNLNVVVTSRRPLKIGAEHEFALPPLEVPPADATESDELLRCPSVALFVSRAEKVKPGFVLSAANAVSVAGICRALDGLPLALELAAARVRILEPAALLQRLDHALDLLTSGDRDLPLRQRTLRATISWSYSLLAPDEQRTLRRLSVFHEGWTFDAMERVCYEEQERFRALDELESLVEKGLVRVLGGGQRYSLLETIRAFSAEQLHAAGETADVQDAHASFYHDFARQISDGIQGGTQLQAMARARAENANTFAAIEWFATRAKRGDSDARDAGLRLCGCLGWYWHIAGLHLVGDKTLKLLLSGVMDGQPTEARARGCFTAGMIGASTGDFGSAAMYWAKMAADGDALDYGELATFGHLGCGYIQLGGGNFPGAVEALDRALSVAARGGANEFLRCLATSLKGMAMFALGDAAAGRALTHDANVIQVRMQEFEGGGLSASLLASMNFASGDIPGAMTLYRDAETAFATVGDKPEMARVQCEMGYAALAGNDLDEARRHFRRALRTYDENGSPPGIGQALIGLAATEAAAGHTAHAMRLATAAQALSERAGVVIEHPMAPGVAERIASIRASIPATELEAIQAMGTALTPAAILEMAVS